MNLPRRHFLTSSVASAFAAVSAGGAAFAATAAPPVSGIAKELADTHALAQSLAINGTPAFIIDDKVSPGYLPADGLTAMIEEVRTGGGCKLC